MADLEAIRRLAESNPMGWKQFMGWLAEYTDGVKDEMVQAPPELLHVCQGRASMLVQLLKTLERAVSVPSRKQ